MFIILFDILFLSYRLCTRILYPLCLSLLSFHGLDKDNYLLILKLCFLISQLLRGLRRLSREPVNHTSRINIVTSARIVPIQLAIVVVPDIYPAELQLYKANTSDKETSFLDLNVKVIGSGIHTSVYDKRDYFEFPIVNFPLLSGDVTRPLSYSIYILQKVRFARCCTSDLELHSKNIQITSKLLTQGYRYHKLRKNIWQVL